MITAELKKKIEETEAGGVLIHDGSGEPFVRESGYVVNISERPCLIGEDFLDSGMEKMLEKARAVTGGGGLLRIQKDRLGLSVQLCRYMSRESDAAWWSIYCQPVWDMSGEVVRWFPGPLKSLPETP